MGVGPPRYETAFIGREAELGGVVAAMADARLVTLTGAGGVGKTRLAVEALAHLETRFGDGTTFVDLARVSDAGSLSEGVLREVALADGRNASGTVTQRLIETLRDRNRLVVLDNVEHLTGATAELVWTLTDECPHLHFLVTSREILNLDGERVVPVAPLSVPAADADESEIGVADSVALFCDRASHRRPGFTLSSSNATAVAELCRRVDGLPLTIELAAARMGGASPADILERIDGPLRLLRDTGHDRNERHESLRAALDWSFGLLQPFEREVFQRCAVFTGGFDLKAAEEVIGGPEVDPYDVLDALSQLVDKSLVDVSEVNGRVRYRLLATIREYALEHFATALEAEVVRGRHGSFFRDRALEAGAGLTGSEEASWVALVDADLDNFGAALQWALDTFRVNLAADIVLGLAVMQMAFDETIGGWCEAILSYPHPEQDPRRPGVVVFACYVRYFFRGVTDAAGTVRELVESVESLPERIRLNVLNLGCGLALLHNWPFREMSDLYLHHARTVGDPFHIVHGLASRAWAQILAGEDAASAGQAVVDAAEALANPSALAIAYQAQAMASAESDPSRAIALLDASIRHAASVRSHFTENVSHSMRSTLLIGTLTPKAAAQALLEAIDVRSGRQVPGLRGLADRP